MAEVSAADWDALAGTQPDSQPFLRHAYFAALEETGCVGTNSGWKPCHLTLWEGGTLIAAMPRYEKTHSYGEYVFDWAWADAYRRNGLEYYPKLLSSVPFTPVTGSRLLARDAYARQALIETALVQAQASGASSFHVLYPEPGEIEALASAGMQIRHGVQFHLQNPGWPDFEAFLESLARDKRKKIRQERRRVTEAGVGFVSLRGAEITPADWRFFARCYANTYYERGQTPYLNLAFFLRLAQTLGDNLLLFIARRDGQPIAAALNLCDDKALYGRYWGAVEHVPLLHFEACYYQGIEYAIRHGFQRFEGGAQGEHKLARGLLPVQTWSAHWLRDARFGDAIQRFLERERDGVALYVDELNEHTPFKRSETG